MAEVTVDKLRVEVKATAEGANKVFTQLAKQLETLKSASSFNTSGLTNLTNALNKVSTSLDTLSSKINTVNGKSVTPKINTDGVTSSQKKIDSSISKIRESLAGLTAYGNAAMSGDSSALTSFDRRVTSIQSSIDVLKAKIASLGDTTVEVNAVDYYEDKIKATRDAIDELIVKEQELAANNIGGDEWDALQEKISQTRDKLDELISKQGEFAPDEMIKVDGLEDEKAALAEFQEQLDETSSDVHSQVGSMSGLEISIGTTLANLNLSQLASQAAKTTKKLLTMAGSAVKSAISGLTSTISKMASSLSKVSVNTDKATGIFKKGFTTILKYGFGIRSLYVLFRRLRQAVKDSFTELQNSGAYYETTKANIDALKDSLSILKYQFGAAFETIFNTVAPALQTFINYLISAMNTLSAFIAKLTGKSTYSKAVKATSDIAGNAGSAANSAKEMAKQLQGFDELNNLSGSSNGGSGGSGGSSGDSSGVTYVTESVDNALGSFTQALSDSINNGEWEQVGSLISQKLKDMMDKIPWDDIYKKAENFGTNLAKFLKGLITEDTFKSLGSTIASALKTALIALKGFSDTLNEVDEKTGKTGWQQFGDSLSAGIKGFVEENPLQLAAETFNSLANGILDGVLSAITSLLDTSEGKSTMQTIAEHIATAIGTVDTKGFGEKLGGIASGIANAVYVLVSNKDTWKNLGTKIADGINGFFTGMNQTNSGTGLTGWQALGKDIQETISGIGDMLITALKGTDWQAVGQGIADMIKEIKWKDIVWEFANLLDAVKDAIVNALKGAEISATDIVLTLAAIGLVIGSITKVILAATITKAVLSTLITEAIKDVFIAGGGAAAIGSVAVEVFSTLAPLMLTIGAVTIGIAAAAVINWQFGKTLGEFLAVWMANKGIISKDAEGEYSAIMSEKLTVKIKDIALSVKEGTFASAWTNMWGDWLDPEFAEIENLGVKIKSITLSLVEGWNNTNDKIWDPVFELGEDIWEGIKEGFEKAVDWVGAIKEMFDSVVKQIKEKFDINSPAKKMEEYGQDIFLGIVEGFRNAFSKLGDEIKALPGKIKDWIKEHFKNFSISDTLSDVIGTIGNANAISVGVELAKQGWDTVTKWVNDAKQFGKDVIKGSVGLIQQGWSTVTNWLNETRQKGSGAVSVFVGLAKAFGTGITTVKEWLTKNGGDSTITSNVSLAKSFGTGIASIADWLYKNGGSYTIKGLVDLDKRFGANIASWIYANGGAKKVEGLVGLKEQFGGSIAAWLNANGGKKVTNGLVNLKKNLIDGTKKAWSTVGQMVEYVSTKSGMKTNAIVNLTTAGSNWNSYSSVGDWVTKKGWVGSVSLTVNLTSGWKGTIAEWLVKMFGGAKQNANGTFTVGPFTAQAGGGSFFGGKWHNIPQFASGTSNALKHGSIFAAGEKGPEVVGHINGRTEVLNRSQLASTMNSAIVKGMAQFRNMQFNPSIATPYSSYAYSSDYSDSNYRNNDMAIAEQNKLLASIDEHLARLEQKDLTISSREVFNATRGEANNYYNRTGNSPFLY